MFTLSHSVKILHLSPVCRVTVVLSRVLTDSEIQSFAPNSEIFTKILQNLKHLDYGINTVFFKWVKNLVREVIYDQKKIVSRNLSLASLFGSEIIRWELFQNPTSASSFLCQPRVNPILVLD